MITKERLTGFAWGIVACHHVMSVCMPVEVFFLDRHIIWFNKNLPRVWSIYIKLCLISARQKRKISTVPGETILFSFTRLPVSRAEDAWTGFPTNSIISCSNLSLEANVASSTLIVNVAVAMSSSLRILSVRLQIHNQYYLRAIDWH